MGEDGMSQSVTAPSARERELEQQQQPLVGERNTEYQIQSRGGVESLEEKRKKSVTKGGDTAKTRFPYLPGALTTWSPEPRQHSPTEGRCQSALEGTV